MGDNASLDDFLGGGSSEESGESVADDEPASAESADEEPADTDKSNATEPEPATDGTDPTADIEPAKTTYAWSGEGTTCEACGETVERRWQQEGGLVCIECKDWERA